MSVHTNHTNFHIGIVINVNKIIDMFNSYIWCLLGPSKSNSSESYLTAGLRLASHRLRLGLSIATDKELTVCGVKDEIINGSSTK